MGSFLFSQIKTLKTAEFKQLKKCFILTEIAKSSSRSDTNEPVFTNVAWQSILVSSANAETKDASNMKRVVFCFHR